MGSLVHFFFSFFFLAPSWVLSFWFWFELGLLDRELPSSVQSSEVRDGARTGSIVHTYTGGVPSVDIAGWRSRPVPREFTLD